METGLALPYGAMCGGKHMTKKMLWAGIAALALQGCATLGGGSATARCDNSADGNRRLVLGFYNEGLVGHQPQTAFMRYMAPDFIEHKPDVPGGTREATATFLSQIIADVPTARWEIIRTIAEGDMVFLHARFTPGVGAPAYALADIFRVRDCKITEHWDVVAPPPKNQRNPNSRF
jgi:predicted SnoaL-like aldol condensation-catalyzing enzyme